MTNRGWISIVITGACITFAGSAFACPVSSGSGEFAPPPRPKPVVIQTSSTAAQDLFERASTLDTAATTHERNAIAFDEQADTFANRARVLRNQAQFVNVSDREGIFDVADELVERASLSRSRASSERSRASEQRAEARTLRDRATQLIRATNGNGGGGWRRSAGGVTL